MDNVSLGSKIKEARQRKGITQSELARAVDINDMYLSEVERGVKMPSMNLFIKLIVTLDVSADYILRDVTPAGKEYVFDEVTAMLEGLTPQQRKTAVDILRAYISNL